MNNPRKRSITASEAGGGVDYADMGEMELCGRMKNNDHGAWLYVLEKVIDQEKRSFKNSRKREEWGVPLMSLISRLYDEMMNGHKLDKYEDRGSLVGWLRTYVRGYLNQENPANSREVSLDEGVKDGEGEDVASLAEVLSFKMSEYSRGSAYGGEDEQVVLRERKRIARRCFRDLWLGNSMQAYVMLLKTKFQLSSLEIKERLGASSTDNVDQMFARAVKKMREAKEKYED